MPEVTIVYWRDIPAQVIVGSGRRASKMPLPERFETAIDRCAMRAGARESDAYLAEWRKGEPYLVDGEAADVASGEAERLEAEFGPVRAWLVADLLYVQLRAVEVVRADAGAPLTILCPPGCVVPVAIECRMLEGEGHSRWIDRGEAPRASYATSTDYTDTCERNRR